MIKEVIFLILMLVTLNGFATTWVESKVDDPIKKGKKCQVHEPASYGGYIYMWPSKYDQVFWPFTDINSIWFCKKSGFVSFMTDFEELNDEEKEEIRKYLKKNKLKKPTPPELIEALEGIYNLRKLKPEYKNMLTRVFARWYQNLGNFEKANSYRKLAYSEIEAQLKTQIEPFKKLEYLYLAANYSRFFGDAEKSNKYIEELNKEIAGIDDPEMKDFGEYLSELIVDTKFIVPGEQLDPVMPDNES